MDRLSASVGLLLCALLPLTASDLQARRSGPAPAEGPTDAGPRLVFNHEKHVVALEISCVDCHLQSTGHRVPAEEVCAGCHDATRLGPEPDCDICHQGADLQTLARGDSLRRGDGMRPELWSCIVERYDHTLHAGEAHCTTCHPKATSSTRSEDRLYPSRRFRCSICHDDEPCAAQRPAEGPPRMAGATVVTGSIAAHAETGDDPGP
jgi:hypothetical protein